MPAPAQGSILPQDTLVGPMIDQLIIVAQQIQGVGRCYEQAPEGPPENNSVIFPLRGWKVLGDTNGKMKVALIFEVMHLFRRTRLQDALTQAQAFLPAWFNVLTDWTNQQLGGLAIVIDLSTGRLVNAKWGGQEYIALAHTVTVLTEFNINTQ